MILLEGMPMIDNAIRKVYEDIVLKTMTIADLGCSSGPNTLLFVSNLIDIIVEQWNKAANSDPIELQIFLNDLPSNDFNQVFRSLGNLEKCTTEQKGNTPLLYYISGLPKSYYNRLFPRESVHLLHSSTSLHWLSKVLALLSMLTGNHFSTSFNNDKFLARCTFFIETEIRIKQFI
jgi:hypothetical protein